MTFPNQAQAAPDLVDVESIDAILERLTALRKERGKTLKIYSTPFLPTKLKKAVDVLGSSDELLMSAKELRADPKIDSLLVLGPSFLSDTIDVLLNAPQVLPERQERRIQVYSPTKHSDCPLNSYASRDALVDCWHTLQGLFDADSKVFPIACLSSSLTVKAFCGEHQGAICTSVNARVILDRAFEQRPKVLFVPDSNLGRFAAFSVGLCESDVVIWNHEENGPESADKEPQDLTTRSKEHFDFNNVNDLRLRNLILWDSGCPTYGALTPNQISELRKTRPNIKIAVPPRCSEEVKERADAVGDLEDVQYAIANTDPQTVWAIGFEKAHIRELKKRFPDRSFILFNEDVVCTCQARTFNPVRLLATLDSLESQSAASLVSSPEYLARPAYDAIDKMFTMLE